MAFCHSPLSGFEGLSHPLEAMAPMQHSQAITRHHPPKQTCENAEKNDQWKTDVKIISISLKEMRRNLFKKLTPLPRPSRSILYQLPKLYSSLFHETATDLFHITQIYPNKLPSILTVKATEGMGKPAAATLWVRTG
ncbi:hypothetical protein H5410_013610 [Solanum commersonii]|uniref:Uncharacterized protein n=1 Tax=Solanum commersonii TaxID=4109 RepID=A0A9J5ZNW6_SOLCO|nr:hypothetical protein H5410_013610 [Solanum commersonii]